VRACPLGPRLALPDVRSHPLKDRDWNSPPLCTADSVLGTAFTIGRNEGEHLIGSVHNLLIAGVITPGNRALASSPARSGWNILVARPRLRAASSAHVSGPLAPPDTITASAGRLATRRSTVSRSIRRRAPTMATALVVVAFVTDELLQLDVAVVGASARPGRSTGCRSRRLKS
jgi:hypothetical protein